VFCYKIRFKEKTLCKVSKHYADRNVCRPAVFGENLDEPLFLRCLMVFRFFAACILIRKRFVGIVWLDAQKVLSLRRYNDLVFS